MWLKARMLYSDPLMISLEDNVLNKPLQSEHLQRWSQLPNQSPCGLRVMQGSEHSRGILVSEAGGFKTTLNFFFGSNSSI